MKAICTIPNCGKGAPVDQAFCLDHRDKSASPVITIIDLDRIAAGDLYLKDQGEPYSPHDMRVRNDFLTGENDDWDSVRILAAHRQAAYAAGVAAERERAIKTAHTVAESYQEPVQSDYDMRQGAMDVAAALEKASIAAATEGGAG